MITKWLQKSKKTACFEKNRKFSVNVLTVSIFFPSFTLESAVNRDSLLSVNNCILLTIVHIAQYHFIRAIC